MLAVSVVLVAAIYMLMAEIPIAAHAVWPDATVRCVGTVNGWLSRHGRTLLCLAATGFGLCLAASATDRLT